MVEQKKTGKWLAEQLGKDPLTIYKWCSNKMQASLEMLSQIAKTLNVDTKELINLKLSYAIKTIKNGASN